MYLIIVLIALLVESFMTNLSELRRTDRVWSYVDWMREKLSQYGHADSVLGFVIVVTLPLLAVWLIYAMLAGVLGLFSFLFSLLVLVLCLGPRDLLSDGEQVVDALQRQDSEAACLYASDLLDRQVAEQPLQLVQTVKEGIFIQGNVRILGVLLWFVLLGPVFGPVGALMFRFSYLLKTRLVSENNPFANASRELYRVLFWLPARVCVLCFAIAGNFVDTMSYWYGFSDLWKRDSEEFVIVSGVGALRYDSRLDKENLQAEEADVNSIRHAIELVKRAVIVWVVVLALLTLAGWLF